MISPVHNRKIEIATLTVQVAEEEQKLTQETTKLTRITQLLDKQNEELISARLSIRNLNEVIKGFNYKPHPHAFVVYNMRQEELKKHEKEIQLLTGQETDARAAVTTQAARVNLAKIRLEESQQPNNATHINQPPQKKRRTK